LIIKRIRILCRLAQSLLIWSKDRNSWSKDRKMKVLKGGVYRVGKISKGMGGVKFFTPGYWLNLFPLKRDKKEEI
jgi:hypothetical protein